MRRVITLPNVCLSQLSTGSPDPVLPCLSSPPCMWKGTDSPHTPTDTPPPPSPLPQPPPPLHPPPFHLCCLPPLFLFWLRRIGGEGGVRRGVSNWALPQYLERVTDREKGSEGEDWAEVGASGFVGAQLNRLWNPSHPEIRNSLIDCTGPEVTEHTGF